MGQINGKINEVRFGIFEAAKRPETVLQVLLLYDAGAYGAQWVEHSFAD